MNVKLMPADVDENARSRAQHAPPLLRVQRDDDKAHDHEHEERMNEFSHALKDFIHISGQPVDRHGTRAEPVATRRGKPQVI